jgi:hypothetical protein
MRHVLYHKNHKFKIKHILLTRVRHVLQFKKY